MAKTFVTGGSGFIGRALIGRLLREGNTVRALVRSAESARIVAELGAEPITGDLIDPSTWSAEVAGAEVMFHLAAETDIDAPRESHELVTVGGTRAAVAAAKISGVSRFVLCGSEAGLLAGDPLLEVDETAPLRPDSAAAYSAAKAVSEQLVLEANGPNFATISIRPRFVWGPGSILIEGLVAAARAGQFAWIGGGRQLTDVTYVDNAVEGLVLGWQRGRPGAAYFVTDEHRVVLREFLEQLFLLYGLDEPIPELDAQTAEVVVPVPARWFLGQPCLLITGKARAELGYRPVISQTAGITAVKNSLASVIA